MTTTPSTSRKRRRSSTDECDRDAEKGDNGNERYVLPRVSSRKVSELTTGNEYKWFQESVRAADKKPARCEKISFNREPTSKIIHVAYSETEKMMYGSSSRNEIFKWKLESPRTLIRVRGGGEDDQTPFGEIGSILYDDQNQKLYVTDSANNDVKIISIGKEQDAVSTLVSFEGEGDVAANRSQMGGMALSRDRCTLYVADSGLHVIRSINLETKEKCIVAGVPNVAGDEDSENHVPKFNGPVDIAYDPNNDRIYVADSVGDRIRRIDLKPKVTVRTLAGEGREGDTDGNSKEARFNGPWSLALNPRDASLYVCDRFNGKIKRVSCVSGYVETLVNFNRPKGTLSGSSYYPTSIAMGYDMSEVYIASEDSGTIGEELRRVLLPKPAKYGPITVPRSTLTVDLRKTFGDPSLPQGLVTFVVGSRRFEHVSKCVLCARCEYFSRMFRSGMKEADASEIQIRGATPEAFETLLKYLMTDSAQDLETFRSRNVEVLVLARFYGVKRLELLTMKAMEANIHEENALALLRFSLSQGDKRLFTKTRRFIVSNGESIRRHPGFAQLDDIRIAKGIMCDMIEEMARLKERLGKENGSSKTEANTWSAGEPRHHESTNTISLSSRSL